MSEADPIEVTEANAGDALAGLPFIVRKALGYALKIKRGVLTVVLPGGKRFCFRGQQAGPEGALEVKTLGFARRLISGGDIGFAEAYIRGEWDSPDVTKFLELFSVNHEAIGTMLGHAPLTRLCQNLRHWLNRNTKAGSKRNIHAHYDLGNAFYSQWLDRTMTYSSALYEPHDNDLSSAQTRKYRALTEEI